MRLREDTGRAENVNLEENYKNRLVAADSLLVLFDVLSLFFGGVGGARDQIQGLSHARQTPYHRGCPSLRKGILLEENKYMQSSGWSGRT